MSWALWEDKDCRQGRTFGTSAPTVFLTCQDAKLLPCLIRPSDEKVILGILTFDVWAVKLHHVSDVFRIVPGCPAKDDNAQPPTEQYILRPETEEHSEVIYLRNGDTIYSERAPIGLTLRRNQPQVQVNSSVTAEGEIPISDYLKTRGDVDQREQETEDESEDEAFDQTALPGINGKHDVARSTPLLSASRSEVVQETPTIDRIMHEMPESPSKKDSDAVADTPPPEEAVAVTAETFSTAPTKPADSENVKAEEPAADDDKENDETSLMSADEPVQKRSRLSRIEIQQKTSKRPSPFAEEEEGDTQSPSPRSFKRRKPNDEDDDAKAVKHTVRKSATKGKKRTSDTHEATPSRSQRSSQRSVTTEEEYEGPKPRVAFSNSAIGPASHGMKFLKKHGGSSVESVTDGCNILCVKPNTLAKTMKLLQSIALGIPIVTDAWLMDSAKTGRFLALSPYIPSAPVQEKEWNFTLADIWNKPLNELFGGYTIAFTPALKATYKDFGEMERVCKAVGARRVVSKKASGKEGDAGAADTIVLAVEEDDADAVTLIEHGHMCFNKDFLTHSILRGKIDLESKEFRIVPEAVERPKKKGRPKKG